MGAKASRADANRKNQTVTLPDEIWIRIIKLTAAWPNPLLLRQICRSWNRLIQKEYTATFNQIKTFEVRRLFPVNRGMIDTLLRRNTSLTRLKVHFDRGSPQLSRDDEYYLARSLDLRNQVHLTSLEVNAGEVVNCVATLRSLTLLNVCLRKDELLKMFQLSCHSIEELSLDGFDVPNCGPTLAIQQQFPCLKILLVSPSTCSLTLDLTVSYLLESINISTDVLVSEIDFINYRFLRDVVVQNSTLHVYDSTPAELINRHLTTLKINSAVPIELLCTILQNLTHGYPAMKYVMLNGNRDVCRNDNNWRFLSKVVPEIVKNCTKLVSLRLPEIVCIERDFVNAIVWANKSLFEFQLEDLAGAETRERSQQISVDVWSELMKRLSKSDVIGNYRQRTLRVSLKEGPTDPPVRHRLRFTFNIMLT